MATTYTLFNLLTISLSLMLTIKTLNCDKFKLMLDDISHQKVCRKRTAHYLNFNFRIVLDICFLILQRCLVSDIFETFVEIGHVIEAAFITDISYRMPVFNQ